MLQVVVTSLLEMFNYGHSVLGQRQRSAVLLQCNGVHHKETGTKKNVGEAAEVKITLCSLEVLRIFNWSDD